MGAEEWGRPIDALNGTYVGQVSESGKNDLSRMLGMIDARVLVHIR